MIECSDFKLRVHLPLMTKGRSYMYDEEVAALDVASAV